MKPALLVIDAQKVYTDPDSEMYCKESKSTIQKINELVERFREKRQPIFLIRHIHRDDASDLGRMFDFTGEPEEDFNFKSGTPEVDYDEGLVRPKNAIEVVKNRYSAFAGTDLEAKLHAASVDTLVICGFMTNFCCDSTARDGHDRDFYVDFIADATGTPGTENMDQKQLRKVVSELLESGYARVSSTKQYLKNGQ